MSVLYYFLFEKSTHPAYTPEQKFFSAGNETGRPVRLIGETKLRKEGSALKEAEYAQRAMAEKERLYRTALLYLGGEAAALDAVDEAVYRGLLACGRLRQPGVFSTWLTRILLNACADELRRRLHGRPPSPIPLKPPPRTTTPFPLRDAVARLPRSCGQWWCCAIFPAIPWRRRRRSLSLPPGTVSTRQRKAWPCSVWSCVRRCDHGPEARI